MYTPKSPSGCHVVGEAVPMAKALCPLSFEEMKSNKEIRSQKKNLALILVVFHSDFLAPEPKGKI